MVIDERSRHRLFVKLEEALGPEEAATLMEHLPPVGWADVATKSDLTATKSDLTSEIARLESRVEAMIHREIAAFERHIITVVLGVVIPLNATLAGLAFAAAKLV